MSDEETRQARLVPKNLESKGKKLDDDGSIKTENSESSDKGPCNLFEKWGMSYADDNASSVYSWGRD